MVSSYAFVQRHRSVVAHLVPRVETGGRSNTTLCAQYAPGYSSWQVAEDELPLCKRCEKRANR